MVLTEVLNYFAEKGEAPRRAAGEDVRPIKDNPRVVLIPQTSFQFGQALIRYLSRLDKPWSLTDCASFLAMEAEGIREAASDDEHFQQAGFTALLRAAE